MYFKLLDMKTIGQIIKDKIRLKGLTQKYVAGQLGITEATFSYYCQNKNKTPIPLEYLEKIAQILECSIDEFCINNNSINIDTDKIFSNILKLTPEYRKTASEIIESLLKLQEIGK